MKQTLTLICAMLLSLSAFAQAQFVPDVLGAKYECVTIEQPDAYDGVVVATLVRHKPLPEVSRAVLYVHGYNDYFFQTEMAEQFIDHEWQFYAVDLRRYGRSMREHHTPFGLRSIDEYFEDIDAAISLMRAEGIEQIVLMGHSTGGLTTSLYCQARRSSLPVDALILNSPFFDMNLGGVLEAIGVPIISSLGSGRFEHWQVKKGDTKPGYGNSISDEWDGEWDLNTQFKRVESLPITAGWVRAIHKAQKQLQAGLNIPCPTLVLYSDKTIKGDYDKEKFKSGDAVLDVKDIAKYAHCIGGNVTQKEVAGGMHDLLLSPAQVRYPLYDLIFEWIDSSVAAQ